MSAAMKLGSLAGRRVLSQSFPAQYQLFIVPMLMFCCLLAGRGWTLLLSTLSAMLFSMLSDPHTLLITGVLPKLFNRPKQRAGVQPYVFLV